MSRVYVYLTGRVSISPSVKKSFKHVAHDAVAFWDSSGRRVRDSVRLRDHVLTALRGDPSGPIREIRHTESLGDEDDTTSLTLESVTDIVESAEPRSVRMTRLFALLRSYADRDLIPRPLVEMPGALHVCTPRDSETLDLSTPVRTGRSRTGARILEHVGRHTVPETSTLIVYDSQQLEYLKFYVGGAGYRELTEGRTVVLMREFSRREGICNGFPIDVATTFYRLDPTGTEPVNYALNMKTIDETTGLSDLVDGLARACDLPPQTIVDEPISSRCASVVAFRADKSSARARRRDDDIDDVEGGLVLDPSTGFHESPVSVFDFRSMYPSIIACDTVGQSTAMREIVTRLMETRSRARDAGDSVVSKGCKLTANALYGQLANSRSPLYDPALANAVTAKGRDLLMQLKTRIRDSGGEVVYGDTDSCMAQFHDDPGVAASRFCDDFNASLPSGIEIVHENTFPRMLIVSKKKYVAELPDGTLHYKGTINRRLDTPPALKSAFESAIRSIFDRPPRDPKTILETAYREITRDRPDEDFLAFRKIGKAVDVTNEATVENIRALRNYTKGDALGFFWTVPATGSGRRTNGSELRAHIPPDRRLDKRKYWSVLENAVVSAITSAFGAIADLPDFSVDTRGVKSSGSMFSCA